MSEPIDGLEPATTYQFAVCAEDSENSGDPFCSPAQTFTTDPDSTRDTVTGRAGQFCGGFCVSIDARSGPSGEDPTGTIGWHTGGGLGDDWSGDVTCLSVTGSSAVIGFSGVHLRLRIRAVGAGLVQVTDNGGPDSALDTFGWADEEGPARARPAAGRTAARANRLHLVPRSVSRTWCRGLDPDWRHRRHRHRTLRHDHALVQELAVGAPSAPRSRTRATASASWSAGESRSSLGRPGGALA